MVMNAFKRGLARAAFAAATLFPKNDFVRRLYHAARNWYEGGWPLLSGDTSYVPQIVQDARFDQNYITRREMLRRMRYWCENSAITEAILSVGERYTVGPSGLHVSFYDDSAVDPAVGALEDEDPWYEAAEQVIAEMFHDAGWNGESMATLLKIGYRCQKGDGDVFFIPTRKRGTLNVLGRTLTLSKPCLQIVEGHRVETPFNKWTNEGITTMDGIEYEIVQIDGRPLMRKTGYWVRAGFGEFEQNSSWTLIPVDSIWHLRNQQRANQPRAVSDFYAVEPDIHRLEDLLLMEMKAQAAQSERAVIVKNAAGQFNPLDKKLQAVNIARGVTPPSSDDQLKQLAAMQEVYRRVYGGQTVAFKSGEDVINQAPNRPSEATLNLFELLVNKICAGAKSPRCLVIEKISGQSAKAQGTEVRAQLDSANDYFAGDFQKWKDFTRHVVIYFMEWAISNDPRVADPPANWRNCIHIQQPKACNVDVGYNAQATTMELASGQTNYDLIYGPRGLSARRELRKLARQQKFVESLGIKLTLPALLPGQIPLDGTAPNATAGKEKEAVPA